MGRKEREGGRKRKQKRKVKPARLGGQQTNPSRSPSCARFAVGVAPFPGLPSPHAGSRPRELGSGRPGVLEGAWLPPPKEYCQARSPQPAFSARRTPQWFLRRQR